MKLKSYFLLLATFILAFSSCKKETVDMTHLLSTVPSSAGAVVAINMESLLEDAGCKVKDNVITPGPEVKKLLEKAASQDQKDVMMLFDGETGIDPKGAVFFYDSNRGFITFALYDVDKFYKFVEKESQGTFTDEGNNVKVCGNVAVKGAQAWVLLTSGKRIDADAISSYSELASSQSFLTTPMGEKLLTEENDVRGWYLLNIFVSDFGRQASMIFNSGLSMLFEDAESGTFKMDFDKGELEYEMKVLNSKGKPAKYQLPAEKVDVNTLKSLGTTCDAMMAFTLDAKLIKKFEAVGALIGGPLFGNLSQVTKNIDGTAGLIGSGNNFSSLNGVVTTKGEISMILKGIISSEIAPISQDGNLIRFSKGDVSGSLSVAECAEELKGCCMGMVMNGAALQDLMEDSSTKVPAGFDMIVWKLNPESGSLEIEIEATTKDKKENALLTLIKGSL